MATSVRACCLAALLALCCVHAASGAWIWDLKVPKNNESTLAVPDSGSTISPSNVTGRPSNSTKAPPPTTVAPPHPRLRSGKSSKAGSRVFSKKYPQNSTTPHPGRTNVTNTTTQPTPTPTPLPANDMQPKIFKSYNAEIPVNPLENQTPIVIVEPDSFGRGFPPALYPQPYGAMPLTPSPYGHISPYPPPAPFSPVPPPPPPPSMPYMPPYNPYPMGGFPNYQWPMEPDYHRPHRSIHYPYFPPVGGYGFSGYPGPYSSFSYPWWRPYLPAPMMPEIHPLSIMQTFNSAECSAEPKRDREEVTIHKTEKRKDEKGEEPTPTYVSLLPRAPVKVAEPKVAKKSTETDPPVPESTMKDVDSEKSILSNNPYTTEDPFGRQNENSYGPYASNDNVERENHILRNNPFQQSAAWPGYSQPQWPDWTPWQQWSPWAASPLPQQYGVTTQQVRPQQYAYGLSSQSSGPQQLPYSPSTQPQHESYAVPGQHAPQQYAYDLSSQPPGPQQLPYSPSSQPQHESYAVPGQHAAARHMYKRQAA